MGSDYWKKVFNIDELVDTGAISPKDIELFQYADTPEDAFELLRKGLTENYLDPRSQRRRQNSHRKRSCTDRPSMIFWAPRWPKTSK